MKDLIADELHHEKVRLAEAVLRVCRLHSELMGEILRSHESIVAGESGSDPLMSAVYLEMALDKAFANPDDAKHDKARLQLIEALKNVWYRVRPELQSRIYLAVREIATIRNENLDQAVSDAGAVLSGAKSAGTALTEQRKAHEDRWKKERAERKGAEASSMRKRLMREMPERF